MDNVTYINADLLAIHDPAGLLEPIDKHGNLFTGPLAKPPARRGKRGASLGKAIAILSSGERG